MARSSIRTASRCVRRSYGSDRIHALAFTYIECVSPAQVLALACSHACRCQRGYLERDSLIRFPLRAELMLCSHPVNVPKNGCIEHAAVETIRTSLWRPKAAASGYARVCTAVQHA